VQNAVTGQWASPFRNPPFTALGPDQIKDVSNITVYYRGTATTTPPNPIPTPAVLPGAIGMGIAALRKKKREQGLEEATQEA
jgi:hypothetical protein